MKNIAIIAALFTAFVMLFAIHPGMVRGVMDVQLPMFQGLPIDTYGERLWAMGVLYTTLFAPGFAVIGGMVLYDWLSGNRRARQIKNEELGRSFRYLSRETERLSRELR